MGVVGGADGGMVVGVADGGVEVGVVGGGVVVGVVEGVTGGGVVPVERVVVASGLAPRARLEAAEEAEMAPAPLA